MSSSVESLINKYLRGSVSRRSVPEGTTELYFTDADGLRIQLQDSGYRGGGCPGNGCQDV